MTFTFFKKIDIFGISFNFSTFGKEKFKTNIGSLITILTLIIIGVFTFLFGQNFYYRQNPIVLNQIVQRENYSDLINITSKKIFFAWRLVDIYGFNYNYTGTFFPVTGSYHYHNFNQTILRYEIVDSVPCSTPEYYNSEFAKSYNPDHWMCID